MSFCKDCIFTLIIYFICVFTVDLMWKWGCKIMGYLRNLPQKADDSLMLSRRGFHVEPGAREKAVSISVFFFSFGGFLFLFFSENICVLN